ncbi:lytic transglycosylase domain-containing protein [Mesobaculum littorinae]|uniref:lytic transglycosylase domain-containing protein n=1 Tax=Mesobaculum littorinae TaxID=2486419 RepID=UPI001F30291C|nr:lytic transglycosylase domain-containing protein [Mesobaculum littorinae]
MRCTADGAHCISTARYVPDLCGVIEAAAAQTGVDPHFFARLLWKESLFDPNAVSPAGAEGIAQFMPGTADLRGLDDPFNPAMAIFASADYLAQLIRDYGNPGLAAAAYNAGEARAAQFVAEERRLPAETRDYVFAITGVRGETWRDDPPAKLNLRLGPEAAFRDACIARAEARVIREFRPARPDWGVIIAAGRRRPTVEAYVAKLKVRHPEQLAQVAPVYVEAVMPGFGDRPRMTAQVPFDDRLAAIALCNRLQEAGTFCQVNRN